MGLCTKVLDGICFLYFFTHIPITVLVDAQAVLPKTWYPQPLLDTLQWYGREFKDPMMLDPPAWFKSFCVCEIFLQFPFFFPAALAFFNGTYRRLRVPLIVYSAHVATTLVAIIAHVLFYDFSQSKFPGPETQQEKLKLIAIYSPYLLVPMLILTRALFCWGDGSEPQQLKKKAGERKKQK